MELSREFELRQKTCWEFKWKIQQAIQSTGDYPLDGIVCVDEFFIGGEEPGIRGRQKGKKKLVIVAVELIETEKKQGVGRAYAKVIPEASSKSFMPFFEAHICKDARVRTDEWTGYLPLKIDYPKLEQVKSDKGKGLPELHNHVMNLKGWLRGIHHHCSEERLQGYLNEYHYRNNRRGNMEGIFDNLIKRMVKNEPKRLHTII